MTSKCALVHKLPRAVMLEPPGPLAVYYPREPRGTHTDMNTFRAASSLLLLAAAAGCVSGPAPEGATGYRYAIEDHGALPPGEVGLTDSDSHYYPYVAAPPAFESGPYDPWGVHGGLLHDPFRHGHGLVYPGYGDSFHYYGPVYYTVPLVVYRPPPPPSPPPAGDPGTSPAPPPPVPATPPPSRPPRVQAPSRGPSRAARRAPPSRPRPANRPIQVQEDRR